MPDDRVTVAPRSDASGSPEGRSDRPVEPAAPPQNTPKPPARRWLRRVLFLLLPLALIAGGYWYVTGGQVMSTDDAYVEADKVGVSTDVSGIVKEVDVTENQQVEAGQVLYRLDDLPFRYRACDAPRRSSAWSGTISTRSRRTTGTCRRRSSRRRTMSTTIDTEFRRQQEPPEQRMSHPSRPSTPRAGICRTRSRSSPLSISSWPRSPPTSTAIPRARSSSIPRYLDAVAQRDEAARQLDHTVVKAPFAGIVTNVPSIAPGKYLAASTTAFYPRRHRPRLGRREPEGDAS